MPFAFIEKTVMLSFPLVLAAVAGGAHTPTNLTTGGKEYEESLRLTYFCRPLRRCVYFVTNGKQPGTKRQASQKRK
jgi:hypothetical protein